MDSKSIKNFILENNKVEEILEELGCHHIKLHSGSADSYYTAGNKDGDNPQAISLYLNDHLSCINYTRTLPQPSDLITLVEFIKDINFFQALKWLHQFLELDLYVETETNIPESIRITRLLLAMKNKDFDYGDDDTPIKVLSPDVQKYYPVIVNDLFLEDGISYATQAEFGVSYENESNRIVFPIFSEFNDLISYKGRLFKRHIEEWEQKYLYLFSCPKSKILFGLNKTIDYIKEKGMVYIGESEKFTMQLWSTGYKNSVGLGGKKISNVQIQKITRLGVPICLALDKDVQQKELQDIADRFIDGVSVYAIMDKENILEEKESPSDNFEKWEHLSKNCIIKIK